MAIIKHTKDQYGQHHSYNDEPAVEYKRGDKIWYHHGKIHRITGPAIEWGDGTRFFYYMNKELEFEQWVKKLPISEEEKTELLLSN